MPFLAVHSMLICILFSAGYAMEKKSSIIAIGLTIHNTPVEIREKLAIPEVISRNLQAGFYLLHHLASSISARLNAVL